MRGYSRRWQRIHRTFGRSCTSKQPRMLFGPRRPCNESRRGHRPLGKVGIQHCKADDGCKRDDQPVADDLWCMVHCRLRSLSRYRWLKRSSMSIGSGICRPGSRLEGLPHGILQAADGILELPAAFSALPSASVFWSPAALPTASLMPPTTCLRDPWIRSLSMMASPFVKDEKVVCAEAPIATGCRSDDSTITMIGVRAKSGKNARAARLPAQCRSLDF
jgi:hypothetical protein